MKTTTRRQFIINALGASIAAPLVGKALTEETPSPYRAWTSIPTWPPLRAAIWYQRLYSHIVWHHSVMGPYPYGFIGETKEGEKDEFVFSGWDCVTRDMGEWHTISDAWRAVGGVRHDGPTPLIPLHGNLVIDMVPADSKAPWVQEGGVIAVARWSEWADGGVL